MHVAAKIEEYRDMHGGTAPEYIFLHISLYRRMVIDLDGRDGRLSSSNSEVVYRHYSYTIKVKITDTSENEDLILAGDESAYNDYVAARELLGDYGEDT